MTAPSRTSSTASSAWPPPAGPGWLDRHVVVARGLLLAVVGAGLALRLYMLDMKSIWLDESYSIWMIRQPWEDFWRYAADLDQHPPLYYVLLRGWTALAGETEVALRLPSVLFGVATLPLVHAIGRAVGGRVLGLLAALLLAVSPLHIQFAQETRMYSLTTMLATASVLCLIRVLGDGRVAPVEEPSTPVGWRQQLATPWWFGLVGCTTLTMLSHSAAVLFALSIAVYLVLAAVLPAVPGQDPAVSMRRRSAAIGLGSAVLLWLPWLPHLLRVSVEVDRDYWVSPPTLEGSLAYWHDIAAGAGTQPRALPMALVLLALACFGAWQLRDRPALVWLLVLVLLVPFVAEQVISMRRPIFYTRTILWSTPPFAVLLAAGLLGLRIRAAIVAVTAALVLYAGWALPTYYAWHGQENWRQAATDVADAVQPGDVVLFCAGWTQLAFDYYYHGPTVPQYGLPATLFDRAVLEPRMRAVDTQRIDGLVAGSRRVWLVYSHVPNSDPDQIARSHLGLTMRQAGDPMDYYSIRIYLYERRDDS